MNPRVIIIAILILVKVLGVASQVKADNYYFHRNNQAWMKFVINNPNPFSDCYESLNDDGQKSIARIACEFKQNEERKKLVRNLQ